MPADVLHAFFTLDAYIVAGLNSEAGITSRQTKVRLAATFGHPTQGHEVLHALLWAGGSRSCGAVQPMQAGHRMHHTPSQSCTFYPAHRRPRPGLQAAATSAWHMQRSPSIGPHVHASSGPPVHAICRVPNHKTAAQCPAWCCTVMPGAELPCLCARLQRPLL